MPSAFSVYVHLPYCTRRCPYCDFNTYAVRTVPEERYAEALLRELSHATTAGPWAGRRVATVFFGGGTPSLFSPAAIGRILEAVDRLFGLDGAAEVTLEANPGSLEGGGEDRLRGFRAAGVNRVSIGAQSFDARHLATLGRAHSADETRDAVAAARRAGFEDISCDLIYAVPGQSLEDWEADLATALALGTDHVSAYCLTYEEGTPMTGMRKAGLVEAADEETELAMLRSARERLGAAGLEHYEVSNWARPGHRSRHNLAYWTWSDYLGLGAGAHGFAAAAGGDGRPSWGRRYANVRLPETYMSAAPGAWHANEEALTQEMAMAEFLMVGLRLSDGIDPRRFEELFAIPIEKAAPRLEPFVRDGLVLREGGSLRLSTRGLEIADAVIARLAAGA